MSEYKEMFVEEAREHLQTLNQTLVDFEENPKDKESMNKIFRAAHTLKGMAAAMNYNEIQTLSHKTEDTLDLIRNNQLDISTDLVDLIFDCFDGLETMVEEIAEADKTTYDTKDLVKKLEGYIEKGEQGDLPQKEMKTDQQKDSKTKQLDLSKTIKNKLKKEIDGGNNVYKIDITVDESCKMKSIRAFLLLKKLRDMGDIVYSDPKEKAIEDGSFDYNFSLLFASQNDINYIYEQVDSVSELSQKIVTPLLIEKNDVIFDEANSIQDSPEKKETIEIKEDSEKTSKISSSKKQIVQ